MPDEVELRVQDRTIVIEPARAVREGWLEAARRMRSAGDDEPIGLDVGTRFDEEEWKW